MNYRTPNQTELGAGRAERAPFPRNGRGPQWGEREDMNRDSYENESRAWKTLGDNTQEAALEGAGKIAVPRASKGHGISLPSSLSASQFLLLPKAVEYKATWMQNDTQAMHSTAQKAEAPQFQDKGDI